MSRSIRAKEREGQRTQRGGRAGGGATFNKPGLADLAPCGSKEELRCLIDLEAC